MLEEARRNLAAKTPDGLAYLTALAGRLHGGGLPAAAAETLPEKDRPVLAAAIHHRCDLLLTGDRTHFGLLYGKTLQGVRILSPAMVAEEWMG